MPVGPRVDTERLSIRPLTEADVTPAYVKWLADPAVNRFLETRHSPQTHKATLKFVLAKNASFDEYLFGIFLKTGGNHIGNIKIGPIRRIHQLGEISLFIGDRSVWGSGFASEAIRAVTLVATKQIGLRKLVATIYADNLASAGAFARAGYRDEAVLPNHYLHEGKPSDIRVFGFYAEHAAA